MCGITGFFDFSRKMGTGQLLDTVTKMTDTLVHRGPDSDGTWVDSEVGIAFGHRRLAVIDLSVEGHQPMLSTSGRYVIIFNGEIYNYKTMRGELEKRGESFRGHSDTEVFIAGMSCWGIQETLQKSNGMFAVALWDKKDRTLYLARDRFGEKPLYYGWSGKTFFFASELKSFAVHPGFHGEIHRDALALYLRYNYIPSPYSIYRKIYKLKPGTFLKLGISEDEVLPSPIPYWSLKDIAQSGIDEPFKGSEDEALEHLELLLRDAVKSRMEADVPLGAFLSGGVDSSLIVALMQAQSTRPVKTFTIGFHLKAYNEAKEAEKIARALGTEHTELYVTPEEAMAVIPNLSKFYDEPFADSSQVPTYLVSQLARQEVTVSLSGDAGDELFGGYSRYFIAQKIFKAIRWMPQKGRQFSANILKEMATLPIPLRRQMLRLSDILSVEGEELMYREMISQVNYPDEVVLGATEVDTIFSKKNEWIQTDSDIQRLMYIDAQTYLPDDILTKVDRASMAVGLESRMPFLDHHLVEEVWRLPISMNVKDGQGKRLLRKVLYQYLDPALFDRPKMGFGIPISEWLRGALKEWAEGLLNEKRLYSEGFFEPRFIRQKWEEHLSEKYNHHYFLWTVLMFQAWLEETHMLKPS